MVCIEKESENHQYILHWQQEIESLFEEEEEEEAPAKVSAGQADSVIVKKGFAESPRNHQ
jgi:hypothetical protein